MAKSIIPWLGRASKDYYVNVPIRLYMPDQFERFMSAFKDGDPVKLILSRVYQQRSLKQNAYYWSVCLDLLAPKLGVPDLESAHRIMMAEYYNAMGGYQNPDNPAKGLSSSAMNTIEFKAYTEWLGIWAAETFGLFIPLPDPNYVFVNGSGHE